MTIRPSLLADIPDLQTVADRTGLIPPEMLPKMVADWAPCAPDRRWLTCAVDGRAIGFCYAVPEVLTDGTWNMLALAVHPDRQGRALGSALVAELERDLCAAGQRILLADTSGTAAFARTRTFYARNGYTEEARICDFWGPGDDKVVFWKALNAA
jgi:ribosomal protein S18 acetylase RimI-like enzyme